MTSQRQFLLERMDRFLKGRTGHALGDPHHFRPAMTISRQCGTGVERISRQLVEYLDAVDESGAHGWALFDQALLARLIEKDSLHHENPPFLAASAKFPVRNRLAEMLEPEAPGRGLFHYTTAAIRSLCRMGNAIIVGRAGNFVTADLPNTFHVRLVGSEERRIAHVRERYALSESEARNMVQESDHGRAQFVERYTGSPIDDPRSYHIVLNADGLGDEVLVRVLADSMLEWAHVMEREKSVVA